MGGDFEIWKRHFINQAKGLIPHQDRFYQVTSEKGSGEGMQNDKHPITIVSPMQQIVERAKTDIINPSPIYDPVTGVVRHSVKRARTVRKYTKKKQPSKRKPKNKKKQKPRKPKGKKKTKRKTLKNKTRKKKK